MSEIQIDTLTERGQYDKAADLPSRLAETLRLLAETTEDPLLYRDNGELRFNMYDVNRFLEQLEVEDVRLAVSKHDEKMTIVGAICTSMGQSRSNKSLCRIEQLVVHEKHRGEDIGSLLMADAEFRALQAGARVMSTLAKPSAISFYGRHGYELVDQPPLGVGEQQLKLMQKSLEPVVQ